MSNASPTDSSTSGDSFNIKPGPPQEHNRRRRLPPDINARNLRIEKQRRERLNESLLDMARLVPSLASVKRPSKKVVVNEAVRHLRQRRDMCISAARDIRDLLAENHRLASELNMLRSQVPGAMITSMQNTRTPAEATLQLMRVEDEPCGDFPDGFAINLGSRRSVERQEMSDMFITTERFGPQQAIFPAGERLSDPMPPGTSCYANNILDRRDSLARIWEAQAEELTRHEEHFNLISSSNASEEFMPQSSNQMAKFNITVDSNMMNQPNGPQVSLEDIFVDPTLHNWVDEFTIDTWPAGPDNAFGF